MRAEIDHQALFQRFEPLLKFTKGERFFPSDVADYVAQASLWVKHPEMMPEELIEENHLDLDQLGSLRLTGADAIHYLQFISPMNIRQMAEFQLSKFRKSRHNHGFQPTRSRLTRVGYLARILDAIFSLLLLMRGRVPGDAMTAATATYEKMLSEKRKFQYYGRVIEQNDWIVFQYWYFYPFNNWRTGYFGANDHEADWEMVNIYCYDGEDGEIRPAWVAYASHNYSGEDLRRHWEDPELEKMGEHPVVYVGGGSHSSNFQSGEYLTHLSIPIIKKLKLFTSRIDAFFKALFRETRFQDEKRSIEDQLTIPFVDYALGDGFSIGPGGDEKWAEPVIITPEPDWVLNYRGLWGFYAQDPFSGEDAPAGPRYNRDGSVRLAWFDPLSWSGMEKLVPPNRQAEALDARKRSIKHSIHSLQQEIEDLQESHYQKGIDLIVYQDASHLQPEVEKIRNALAEERKMLIANRESLTVNQAVLKELEEFSPKMPGGEEGYPREYLPHPHQPQMRRNLRFPILAEIWAAVSIGTMMIAVVLLIVFARPFLFWGLIALFLVMITIEAAFRSQLSVLVRWTSIGLAVLGFFILLIKFFWIFALVALMVTGFYMIVENLRELIARR